MKITIPITLLTTIPRLLATTCRASFCARDDGPKNEENHARIDGLLARANAERECQDGRSVWACWRSPLGQQYVTERDGDGRTLWVIGVGADDAPL